MSKSLFLKQFYAYSRLHEKLYSNPDGFPSAAETMERNSTDLTQKDMNDIIGSLMPSNTSQKPEVGDCLWTPTQTGDTQPDSYSHMEDLD